MGNTHNKEKDFGGQPNRCFLTKLGSVSGPKFSRSHLFGLPLDAFHEFMRVTKQAEDILADSTSGSSATYAMLRDIDGLTAALKTEILSFNL